MLGLTSSPLLTSTHLTVTGGLPVLRRASAIGFFNHTPLASKKSNSFFRAAATKTESNTCPVRSSRYIGPPSICISSTCSPTAI